MNPKVNIWLRAIRFRFLAASALSVTCGIALTVWNNYLEFSVINAILVYAGIFCLHCSVDLLNDYSDFKRGIDLRTSRTKFSGGTGVLPEGLLTPKAVYRAAVIFLIIGLGIGGFFVITKGFIIGIILTFAALSILLYSTKLVNIGLGEVFVGIKGTLVVIGTYFVQTSTITVESVALGVLAGMLSSLVLYVNSIPDIRADKEGGRRTLAILLEARSNRVNYGFLIGLFLGIYVLSLVFFAIIIPSIISALVCFVMIPLTLTIVSDYHKFIYRFNTTNLEEFEKIMNKTVLFSRTFGLLLIAGVLIATFFRP
ncbi:MAG TPA: prenyltransferase [Candidatus Nitrosocosmicus sp.]|nr:prenyltransferase [Candidatus Nitrosocosmicus sp.]